MMRGIESAVAIRPNTGMQRTALRAVAEAERWAE